MEYNPDQVIHMNWNLSSFLPIKEDKIITESLYPMYFDKNNKAEPFWSVLERTVDIRWITEQAGMLQHLFPEEEPASLQEYRALEQGLFCIVSQFGSWSASLDAVTQELGKSIHEKSAFIEYWKNYNANILEAQKNGIDALTVIQLMKEPIEKFSQITIKGSSSLYKHLKSLSEEFIQHNTPDKAKEFARKVQSFLNNQLQIEIKGNHWDTLKHVYKMQKKVAPEWLSEDLPSQLYRDIQETVDQYCQELSMVNGHRNSRYWAREMQNQIDEVIRKLDLTEKAKEENKRAFDDYMTNGSRCVALCKNINNKIGVLAFSGYFDCQDDEVIEIFGLNRRCNNEMISNMEKICSYLATDEMKIFLSKLNECAVDEIERYEVNQDLRFIPSGPMREDIKKIKAFLGKNMNVMTEKELSDISRRYYRLLRKEYACCERKILSDSYVSSLLCQGYMEPELILYVKFRPCINCYGAITLFQRSAYHVTVRYPDPFEW